MSEAWCGILIPCVVLDLSMMPTSGVSEHRHYLPTFDGITTWDCYEDAVTGSRVVTVSNSSQRHSEQHLYVIIPAICKSYFFCRQAGFELEWSIAEAHGRLIGFPDIRQNLSRTSDYEIALRSDGPVLDGTL